MRAFVCSFVRSFETEWVEKKKSSFLFSLFLFLLHFFVFGHTFHALLSLSFRKKHTSSSKQKIISHTGWTQTSPRGYAFSMIMTMHSLVFSFFFFQKKKSAFRFVSNSARGKYLASSSFPISLSDFSKISLSLSLSLYALWLSFFHSL